VTEDDAIRRKQAQYEQAQRLFLEALSIEPPSAREEWLQRQTEHCKEVLDAVGAMLRADADIEHRLSRNASRVDDLGETTAPDISPPKSYTRPFPSLENYEIHEEIARGGMGVVYKARQIRPSRMVAIKMMRAGSFASTTQVERFFTEAEAAAQLDDESVVPVYEFGEVNGEPFIAMKYIDGEDLESLLARNALSMPACLNILSTICGAVSGAHDRGIIHRDIKPSNILIDRVSGRPWITDFGIAKYLERDSAATNAGDVMGTPGYMAPEQAFGDACSATRATDVYGLGAILYRVLTGRPPIQTDSANLAVAIQLIREHDVVPPRSINRGIPRALNTIWMKCLESNASHRYVNARELADDLRRYLDGEAIQAKPLDLTRRLHRWARHRPGLAVTWCVLAVFYAYHLLCRLFGWYYDPGFDQAVAAITVSAALSAWIWQLLLRRTDGEAWVLYAWVSCDVALLTLLLFSAKSANSELVLLYHVIVAGSVLRCRTDLVAYVTLLTMSGYGMHLAYLQSFAPTSAPPTTTYLPTFLSLALIGIIQYFSLRKSAASYEARGTNGSASKLQGQSTTLRPKNLS
jgi:eukaryotic-like serine/threonine-protein kinase